MSAARIASPGRRLWLKAGALGIPAALGMGAYHALAAPKEVAIKLTVKRFEYSRKVIHLKKGVPVVIQITSLDVPHGFSVPDFNARAEVVMPGKITEVRFTPDKTGEFLYLCDVFCGDKHESLYGKFIVRA
jgi:cytochrome c oxidase subunit 2